MLHHPVSVPTRTEVATGCNRLCALEARPDVLRTGTDSVIIPEHSTRSEKGGGTTIHGQSTEKIQVVQDSIFEGGSQVTEKRDDLLMASQVCQEIQTTMNDLRNWTRVQPQRETNNKGQSKSVQQSHFEPEAADNKSRPLETTVAKENLNKIQIKAKTRYLSDG